VEAAGAAAVLVVLGGAGGTVARRFRYDAYGQPAAYTPSGQSASLTAALPGSNYVPDHLYTGQRWVSAAAPYDYGARFYDPQLVQFVSQDPVQEYVSPYAYVRWNPVRWTDPTGMFSLGAYQLYASVGGARVWVVGLVCQTPGGTCAPEN